MKKWNFKIKGSAQEIIKKLDLAFESAGGFIFKVNQDHKDSVIFNVGKPVKYPDQILHRNRISVNGKVFQTEKKNESDVEITFSQHIFMSLTVFSIIVFGLALVFILSKMSISAFMYFIFGGILLGVGIVLWIALQKKFETDIQKYKTFISKILES